MEEGNHQGTQGLAQLIDEDNSIKNEQKSDKFELKQNNEVQAALFKYDRRSLFIFSQSNWFRKKIIKIIESPVFDYFILLIIIVNSIVIALYDYSDRDSHSKKNQILNDINYVLTSIFTLECLLKIIGMGFIVHKKSYARDFWNLIDLAVVLSGLIEFLPIPKLNLKSLRIFRILRPLRSINAIPALKKQVRTLIKALPKIANVFLFLFFMFYIFGIIGLYQYNGVLYNACRQSLPINYTYWPKLQGEDRICSRSGYGIYKCPANYTCHNPSEYTIDPLKIDDIRDDDNIQFGILNFDNIGSALLTIFNIVQLNEWSKLMYNLMDAGVPSISVIFHIAVIIFGAFFIVNLLFAVIVEAFITDQKEQLEQMLNDQHDDKDNQEFSALKALQDLKLKFLNLESNQKEELNKKDAHQNDKNNKEEELTPKRINKINQVNDEQAVLKQMQDSNRDDQNHLSQILRKKNAQQKNKISRNTNDIQQHQGTCLQSKEPQPYFNTQTPQIRESQINQFEDSLGLNLNQSHLLLDQPSSKIQSQQNNITSRTEIPTLQSKLQDKFAQKVEHALDERVKSETSFIENMHNLTVVTNFKQLNKFMKQMSKQEQLKRLKQNQVQAQETKINKIQLYTQKLIQSRPFILFIQLIIVANTVALCLDRYPQPKQEDDLLNLLNIIFTSIFGFEMLLKLVAIGPKIYAKDLQNVFDCILVLLSIIDIAISETLQNKTRNMKWVTAFRSVRLLRVFKLAQHWKQFQLVLLTIQQSIIDVSTFSMLLFLFMFIYALLALELFGHKAKFNDANQLDMINGSSPQFNFDTFLQSILTVFIVLTNDGWTSIFFSYYRSLGGIVPSIYFVTLLIIGQKILINLFLVFLTRNFDEIFEEEDEDGDQEVKDNSINELKQNQSQSFKTQLVQKLKLITGFFSTKPKIKDKKHESQIVEERLQKLNSFTKTLSSSFVQNDEKLHGKSLFFISSTNCLRKFIFKIINNWKFELLITLVIILSGVQLALENPLNPPKGKMKFTLNIIDIVTTVIFTAEAILKIIAFGFIFNGEYSYLRNLWNLLDFVIVCLSLATYSNVKRLQIFKMFRIFRPLRIISKNEGLKTAVIALALSIPNLLTILLITFLFFIIFGILGVNYMKGALYACDFDSIQLPNYDQFANPIITKWDCLNIGGTWLNSQRNFDDIIKAFSFLFQIATLSGWSSMMLQTISAVGINYVNQDNNNPYFAFYYIIFIIIGSFFMMNLFVGVVIMRFQKQKEKIQGNQFLTPQQQEWVDIKVSYLLMKPIKIVRIPTSGVRCFIHKIITSKQFDILICAIILFNAVVLSLKWYQQNELMKQIIDSSNTIFTFIYTIECVLKVIALDKFYFKDPWNIYDFIITIGSLASYGASFYSVVNLKETSNNLRVFRVCRLIRLLKISKPLNDVFNTFIISLPAMLNVGGLLFLILFMYSILGISIFAEVQITGALTEFINFQSFSNAFLVLFVALTGDGWNDIMNSYQRVRSITYQCMENPTYDDYLQNGNVTVGCGKPGEGYIAITTLSKKVQEKSTKIS